MIKDSINVMNVFKGNNKAITMMSTDDRSYLRNFIFVCLLMD